jgi:hypothetical protein
MQQVTLVLVRIQYWFAVKEDFSQKYVFVTKRRQRLPIISTTTIVLATVRIAVVVGMLGNVYHVLMLY